jgi:hypothetical protein
VPQSLSVCFAAAVCVNVSSLFVSFLFFFECCIVWLPLRSLCAHSQAIRSHCWPTRLTTSPEWLRTSLMPRRYELFFYLCCDSVLTLRRHLASQPVLRHRASQPRHHRRSSKHQRHNANQRRLSPRQAVRRRTRAL